ncbi:unnamed protein product [Heligmosomoides polygyrus]|uniref:Reverse transcriptase domain-containing protein n=1 Tax=Heligmosomoides polygyrus TaxID=6339 RepID=A0A183F6Q7_HELPZ|nr:unnamed protein product [Heligmosomoides polygyrus]
MQSSQASGLTSQEPSLGLTTTTPAVGECLTRNSRTKGVAWSPREVLRLSQLVLTNCDTRGRKQWVNIASAWELARSADEPVRTVPSLTKAYYKFVKPTEHMVAPVQQDVTGAPQTAEMAVPYEVAIPPCEQPPAVPEAASGPLYVDLEDASEQAVANTTDELKAAMAAEFRREYRRSIMSLDRQPLRRPEGEIPKRTLRIGNEILAEELQRVNAKSLTSLNAAVHAIAKVIAARVRSDDAERLRPQKERLLEAVQQRNTLIRFISILTFELRRRTAVTEGVRGSRPRPTAAYRTVATLHGIARTHELRRLLIRFKDELNIVRLEVNTLEDAKQRYLQRRRGAPPVAREPRAVGVSVPVDEVREHWKPIVGVRQPFTNTTELSEWAANVRRDAGSRSANSPSTCLSEADWKNLFSRVKPWKVPGPDGIQGFWWKHLPEAKNRLMMWCLRALHRPRDLPRWLCRGRVALIPKGKLETPGPGDFRPIACLNTCYKVLTAMLAHLVTESVGDRFPREQIALRKGVWGCTHAHILDQTVCKDAIQHRAELHMLWVDMTKAFDSVSHDAIKWTLSQWGVPYEVRRLLATIMSKQSVRYFGYQNGKSVKSAPLEIRNGLMQGDTLSPLLFCLAIAPISDWLHRNVTPFRLRTQTGSGPGVDDSLTIGHIFYMDDLKVYTTSRGDLLKAKDGIRQVAQQLGLRMNPDKCAVNSLNGPAGGDVGDMGEIPVLGANSLYKYLGAEQNTLVAMADVWQRVQVGASAASRRLWLSNLTVRQKVDGYNQIVLPKLKYAISCVIFGVGRFDSLRKSARDFDMETRKLLAESKTRFKCSCTSRLYVSKANGGLGLKSVEEELEHTIVYTWCYLASNPDFIIPYTLATGLERRSKRSLTSDFQKITRDNGIQSQVTRTPLAHIQVNGRDYTAATPAARAISCLIHERWSNTHLQNWKSKEVASRVLADREGQPDICLRDSFLWSMKGWVCSHVLRNVWSVQECSLRTKASASGRHASSSGDQMCRMCHKMRETAEHIVSVCEKWRTNVMVERHDDVARVLYYSLKRKYDLCSVKNNTRLPHVVDNDYVEIHWNMPIVTDEHLVHNRPDIMVWDKREKRIWIIEISVSWYTRVSRQERRKLHKYGTNSTLAEETAVDDFYPGPNLRAALQRERKCRVDVIPIVMGTCGECTTNLRRHVNSLKLPDKTDWLIEKLERNAVLGTNRLVKCHLANTDV